ncbi:cytochrome P450 [Actinoplanes sp. NPDC051346]|uniref:cytochrome P450 n=1 Tax=Actinoplanes sp. NPDC051346 TaxID=3155048 RepID=UPI0034315849
MPSHTPSKVEANLFSHDFLVDPYPTYRLLREQEPVHWDDKLNGWVITRHADVYAAHLDPETYSSHRLGAMVSNRVGPEASDEMRHFMDIAPEWMLFRDPPDHTRIRRELMSEFRPQSVRAMRDRIDGIVSDLIDDLLARQSFDLVEDFGYKLPGQVLAAQYGLPLSDGLTLTDWWYEIRNMQRVFLGADPATVAPTGSPVAEAFNQLIPYLRQLVEDRERAPQDDLVTKIISFARRTEDGGEANLDDAEMFAHLMLLPLASFGTTMDLITNGLLGLMRQRDQWELLKAKPDLTFDAVEEVLRFDASVQLTHRLVTRDIEIAGTPIAAGELVYLVRGAANRDPRRWSDPDRIDITRADPKHVGFGVGIHRCLGASLAQMVTACAYSQLASRVPNLHLDPERPHSWKADTPQFRGLNHLPAIADAPSRI